VIKSRILALALIGIILSSGPLSLAEAYAISDIRVISLHILSPQLHKIDLVDGIAADHNQKYADMPNQFSINLVDGISAIFSNRVNDNGIPYHINLIDGIFSLIMTR